MKKTYIAPQVNVVTVNNCIICTSGSLENGGSGTPGDEAGSRYNTIDFYDDDEE